VSNADWYDLRVYREWKFKLLDEVCLVKMFRGCEGKVPLPHSWQMYDTKDTFATLDAIQEFEVSRRTRQPEVSSVSRIRVQPTPYVREDHATASHRITAATTKNTVANTISA